TVSRLSLKCRAPPGTSPFPYTTLFRSGLLEAAGQRGLRRTVEVRARTLEIDMVNVFTREGELLGVMNPRLPPATADAESGEALRSEEHTSELQSLTNLVCRLLLEKKKS